MNPPCAFCKKTVYPTEKFNCLDKIWHKGCFKCTTCSLKLTMNTYKGYEKKPYCKAHYPHLTATQVSQTVEGRRLQSISKQQSQVEYHKQHNKDKGTKMSVADDPETQRQKQVSRNQSNVVYQNRAGQKAAEELRRPTQDDQPEPGRGGYQPPPQQQSYQPPPQPQPPYQPPPQTQQDYNEPPPTSYGGGYDPEPEPPAAPQANYSDPQPQSDMITFKALYDYEAADSDEVSFQEGDILQGNIIDEGWIEGTVAGHFGMAPRNYFEQM